MKKLYAVNYVATQGSQVVSYGLWENKIFDSEDKAWDYCVEVFNSHKPTNDSHIKDRSDDYRLLKEYYNDFAGLDFKWCVIEFEMD